MTIKLDLSETGYGGRSRPIADLDGVGIMNEITTTMSQLDMMEITGKVFDEDGQMFIRMSEAISNSINFIDVMGTMRDQSPGNFGAAEVEATYTQLCLMSMLINPNAEIPVRLSGHDIARNPDAAMDLILQAKVGFTDKVKSGSSKWLSKFVQAFLNLIKQVQIAWKKYVSNYEDTYDEVEKLKSSEYNEAKSKSSRSYMDARSSYFGTRAALTTATKFMFETDVKYPDNDEGDATTMSDVSKKIMDGKPFSTGKVDAKGKLIVYGYKTKNSYTEAIKELRKVYADFNDRDHNAKALEDKIKELEEKLANFGGVPGTPPPPVPAVVEESITIGSDILLNRINGVTDLQSLFGMMESTQLLRGTNHALFADSLKDLDEDAKPGTKDEDIRLYGFTDKTAMALYKDKSGDWTTRRISADKDIHLLVKDKQAYSTNIAEAIMVAKSTRTLFRNFSKIGSNMQKLITNIHKKYQSDNSEYADIPTIITIARSMYTSLWRDMNNGTSLCEAATSNLVKK